jgi:hypothetical protein
MEARCQDEINQYRFDCSITVEAYEISPLAPPKACSRYNINQGNPE